MKKLLIVLFAGLALGACKKEAEADICVDPALKDPAALCTGEVDPVCGCDGNTYTNACVAEVVGGVTSFTQGGCGCTYKYRGEVVDRTGLDGCGLMIELDNGKFLEPLKVPNGFTLTAGAVVELDYRVFTTYPSTCMAGELADIVCIREVGCEAIELSNFSKTPEFGDAVYIKNVEIIGNCLQIDYSHGGGCEVHDVRLRALVSCGTPPITIALEFGHEANGDNCEALIYGSRSYDLSVFQTYHEREVSLYVMDKLGTYSKSLKYTF